LLLYKLNQIDRELNELISLRGDIPERIDDLTSEKKELDERVKELQAELDEIFNTEKSSQEENEKLLEKMEKDDGVLRSGALKTNKEYDAMAKEIEDARLKINENEKQIKEGFTAKKEELKNELTLIRGQLDEINGELEHNSKELEELTKQTEEEEKELISQREEILPKIPAEDMEFYIRINKVKYGEAIAVVRKGSCLGCYSSIPPQKTIEIRMAERFYSCESCGRILIAEELLTA
jgi:predicted  nucleic acid-binding Zn-ribbon protein